MVIPIRLRRLSIQASEYQMATQGIDDAQHLLQANGGFTPLEFDDKTQAYASSQGQIGLGETQAFSGGSQGRP
jgi:hypothetical protein